MPPPFKMLDLFAGLEGWSEPWRDRGHKVFSVDFDLRFDVDLHKNILALTPDDLPWRPDVILASPPCETFSVMTMGRNWNYDWTPKTEKAADHYALLVRTLNIMAELEPKAWIIENPRGYMRKLPVMRDIPRRSVTYCRYGLPYMKPTDLWGVVPMWRSRAMCENGNPDHIAAPRGSYKGIQGNLSAPERAKVPWELSEEIMLWCEAYL